MVYQNMKNRTVLIVYDTFWLVLGLFWLFTICYGLSYLETFWFGTSEKKVLALKKCWFWYISKDAFTNIIQIMIQYNDTLQWYKNTSVMILRKFRLSRWHYNVVLYDVLCVYDIIVYIKFILVTTHGKIYLVYFGCL